MGRVRKYIGLIKKRELLGAPHVFLSEAQKLEKNNSPS